MVQTCVYAPPTKPCACANRRTPPGGRRAGEIRSVFCVIDWNVHEEGSSRQRLNSIWITFRSAATPAPPRPRPRTAAAGPPPPDLRIHQAGSAQTKTPHPKASWRPHGPDGPHAPPARPRRGSAPGPNQPPPTPPGRRHGPPGAPAPTPDHRPGGPAAPNTPPPRRRSPRRTERAGERTPRHRTDTAPGGADRAGTDGGHTGRPDRFPPGPDAGHRGEPPGPVTADPPPKRPRAAPPRLPGAGDFA